MLIGPSEIPGLDIPSTFIPPDSERDIFVEKPDQTIPQFETCETVENAYAELDRLVGVYIEQGKQLITEGCLPREVVDAMTLPLEDISQQALYWINTRTRYSPTYGENGQIEGFCRDEKAALETIQSFRLRLKAASFSQEVLWCALTEFAPDDRDARAERRLIQSQLAHSYAQGLDLIFSGKYRFEDYELRKAALQEVTVATLLSIEATPQGAYFISSQDRDRHGADGIIHFFTAYRDQQGGIEQRYKQELIQVKSSGAHQLDTRYSNVTIVDAFATGNRQITCPDHRRPYTWKTADALYRLLFAVIPDEERKKHIQHIKTVLGRQKNADTPFAESPADMKIKEVAKHQEVCKRDEDVLARSTCLPWLRDLIMPFDEGAFSAGAWGWDAEPGVTLGDENFARRIEEINKAATSPSIHTH